MNYCFCSFLIPKKIFTIIQVFVIELFTFAVDFVLLAVEFGIFALEFVPFAVQFITLAMYFVALAMELGTFAFARICRGYKTYCSLQ